MSSCKYCSNPLPERGYYCPKCSKQVRCKDCNEELELNAKVCVMCGSNLGEQSSKAMNTIEYSETKSGKRFKSTFTDEVGRSIGEAFGMILKEKANAKPQVKISNALSHDEKEGDESETIDTEYQQVDENSGDHRLERIFRESGDKITLKETRLKAKTKRDFSIRLTLLFLLYRHEQGQEKVLRSDLTSLLKDASVEDANWRYWLKNNNVVGVHDSYVELKAPGREQASEILEEVCNAEIEDKWKLGTSRTSKRGKKKEKKINV